MVDISSYLEKLQVQLRDWDTKLDGLKEKAQNTQENVKGEFDKQMHDIAKKQEDFKQQVQKLADTGKSAGEDLVSGIQKAGDDLKTAMQDAIAKFMPDTKNEDAPVDHPVDEPNVSNDDDVAAA